MRNVLYWAGSLGMVGCSGSWRICVCPRSACCPRPFRSGVRRPRRAQRRSALGRRLPGLSLRWLCSGRRHCLHRGLWPAASPVFGKGSGSGSPRPATARITSIWRNTVTPAAEDKRNLIVFYPLYPLLIRLLGGLLGGRYALAGLAISQGCWAAAAAIFRALAGRRLAPGGARAAAAAFLFYPFSFFCPRRLHRRSVPAALGGVPVCA